MLIFYPLTQNLIVISTFEKVTITNPTYLFRFVNKETKIEYSCISAPIDTYSYNRQSFQITTKTSGANNLLGEIVLTIGDEYDYYIYAQESTTNLDYTLANELIEEGVMKYEKTITERNSYERGTTTRKVYTR